MRLHDHSHFAGDLAVLVCLRLLDAVLGRGSVAQSVRGIIRRTDCGVIVAFVLIAPLPPVNHAFNKRYNLLAGGVMNIRALASYKAAEVNE